MQNSDNSTTFVGKDRVVFQRSNQSEGSIFPVLHLVILVTKYQEKLNEMAGDLCIGKPAMLTSRGELLELAQERLRNGGYQQKKENLACKSFERK